MLRVDLLNVMADLNHTRVASQLIQWATDSSAGLNARVAAIGGLGRLDLLDRDARSTLLELLKSEQNGIRRAVVDSLAKYDDAVSRKALQTYYKTTVSPREKRTIEAVFNH